MPDALYPWMHLIGRVMFAVIFIAAGINNFTKLDATAMHAQTRGAPGAKAMTVVLGLLALVGGVLIVLGWRRFIGAGLIVIFCLLTAFLMHNFWRDTDQVAKQNEKAHFMKNIAMAGAALFMAHYGGMSWPMSMGG